MNFTGTKGFHARATYRSKQTESSMDVKIKKFWDNLADDLLALYSKSLSEKDKIILLAYESLEFLFGHAVGRPRYLR